MCCNSQPLFYIEWRDLCNCRPADINYKVIRMSPFCDKTRFCNLIFELHSGVLKEKDVKKKKKKKAPVSWWSALSPLWSSPVRLSGRRSRSAFFFFFFWFLFFWGGLWCHVNRRQKHSDRMDFITRSLHLWWGRYSVVLCLHASRTGVRALQHNSAHAVVVVF